MDLIKAEKPESFIRISCCILPCLSLTPLAFVVPISCLVFSYCLGGSHLETHIPSICSQLFGPVGLQSEHFGSWCGGKQIVLSIEKYILREHEPYLMDRHELDLLIFDWPVWSQTRSHIAIINIVLSLLA